MTEKSPYVTGGFCCLLISYMWLMLQSGSTIQNRGNHNTALFLNLGKIQTS